MARTSQTIGALAALVAAGVLGVPAHAVFPGANGEIVASTVVECGSESEPDYFGGPTWSAPLGGRAVSLSLRGSRPYDPGRQAAFSPNGKRLAYRSSHGIIVSRVDGSRPQRLSGGNDSDPAWSPRGDALAFIRNGALYLVRADGRGLPHLLARSVSQFAWSPQGDQLAVVTVPPDFQGDEEEGPPILAVGLDGSVREIGRGTGVRWSRAGWLAYAWNGRLYVTRAGDAPAPRLVASQPNYISYTWSPDGRRLAVAKRRLSVIDPAGKTDPRVLPGQWRGDRQLLFFSPNGRLIASLTNDNRLLVTPTNGEPTRLGVRFPRSIPRDQRDPACGPPQIVAVDWQARAPSR